MSKSIPLSIVLAYLLVEVALAQSFPEQEWNYLEDPAAYDWNTEVLDNFRDYIVDSSYVTGLMIVQNGIVVFD